MNINLSCESVTFKHRYYNPIVSHKELIGITLSAKPGDRLAITGKNGTGKTTLLQILSGILPIHSGRVMSKGSVSSFIEMNSTLYPSLTGRNNVKIMLSIFGINCSEAEENKIHDFSDLGEYFDQPVCHYSSGMRVKLHISILIHSIKDILILDEWLSTSDRGFNEKIENIFIGDQFKNKIIILATHNKALVEKFCTSEFNLDNKSWLI